MPVVSAAVRQHTGCMCVGHGPVLAPPQCRHSTRCRSVTMSESHTKLFPLLCSEYMWFAVPYG